MSRHNDIMKYFAPGPKQNEYEARRKIIIEANSDDRHILQTAIPSRSIWTLKGTDLKYDDGVTTVIIDVADPDLPDRVEDVGSIIIVTI